MNPEHREQRPPYSLKELLKLRYDFMRKLGLINMGKKTHEQRKSDVQDAIKLFIAELKEQNNQFKSIFTTESGSEYFVTQTGESLRFRLDQARGYEIQPIMKQIKYIDNATAEDLLNSIQNKYDYEEAIIGREIPTVELSVGVYPLEFGLPNRPEIVVAEELGYIKIMGTKMDNEIDSKHIEGFHLGHSVSIIEKS
jgi:hypothetical protein